MTGGRAPGGAALVASLLADQGAALLVVSGDRLPAGGGWVGVAGVAGGFAWWGGVFSVGFGIGGFFKS